MAAQGKWYGKGLLGQFGAAPVNWGSDTIKVALCTSSYALDQDAHQFFSDLTNEVSGTGYTAGGATFANKTSTYTGSTNVVKLDADDVSWPSSTIVARYAIIYKSTGVAGTSPLLGFIDFGTDVSTTTATLSITFDAAGILNITAA